MPTRVPSSSGAGAILLVVVMIAGGAAMLGRGLPRRNKLEIACGAVIAASGLTTVAMYASRAFGWWKGWR
ncbi:MAG: hypothetical protein KBC96_07830 [Armatimonadetes bacterium]|nr:hypothetical protein [Armatimonadota bacterium]